MFHRSRATAFALVLIWIQAGAVDASTKIKSKHGRTARIAVLLDLEGAQASIGRPAMNGFVLGLQEASEDGPTLFAALVDTKSDPQTTRSDAKAIVSSVSIAAGFTDNDSVLIAGPYFQRERVPFLSIGATDPSLPEEVGESIFLVPFGDNTQAAAGAEFARREFGGSVAILWDSTSQYTRTLPRYFRTRFEELGGNVLIDSPYAGGCDISQLGAQVEGLPSAPQFIYLAGLPDCIGEVVASLRAAGVSQPILGRRRPRHTGATRRGSGTDQRRLFHHTRLAVRADRYPGDEGVHRGLSRCLRDRTRGAPLPLSATMPPGSYSTFCAAPQARRESSTHSSVRRGFGASPGRSLSAPKATSP